MPKTKTIKKGIQAKIKPLGSSDSGLKILLYGQSKSGKTTLWETFPRKILAIICSGGNEPGELKSIDTPENRKSIDTLELDDSNDLTQIVEFLSNGEHDYETIVLDHVTGLQDLILKEVLGLDKIPVVKNWGIATQQEYGTTAIKCKTYLRELLGLPINVVIIGQEREFEKSKDSELLMPTVGVALMPSLTGWLNSACDYICQTFKGPKYVDKTIELNGKKQTKQIKTKGVEYNLRIGPHEIYTTGFRIPKSKGIDLPETITDPSYDKIMELIK